MIKSGSFFAVQSFMINDLHLKGTELLIYALIYGFSQDGESYFNGSIQYLQDWTGAGRTTVFKTIQKLCDKGLIEKIERSGKACLYKATYTAPVQNLNPSKNDTRTNSEREGFKNCTGTRSESEHDNIDNNIEIDIERTREEKQKLKKHKYGEYKNVLLTDEELEKLKQEFPSDYNRRIERLSEYIETHKHGRDYKNHLAVIRSWARRDAERGQPQQSADRPEYDDSVIEKLLAKGGFNDERTAVQLRSGKGGAWRNFS